jgi:HSP20 family protein
MSEPNKPAKAEESKELSVIKKKATPKKTTTLTPRASTNLWQEFDNTFARFRNDFEDLLFPSIWSDVSIIPQVRVPVTDLQDNEKEYVVTAEMPGFKKEDIELEVQDNSISITGYAGWKYDEKGKLFVCKERACETFYREIELPEEIKLDDVKANLTDGVLEVILPKKAPKEKRKVSIK